MMKKVNSLGPPKLEKSHTLKSEVSSGVDSGVSSSVKRTSMITSEQNKILTGSEINIMKLEKGEQVEFQCYTP